MTDDSFLTPEVVEAVKAHMNGDHGPDNVTICRGLGQLAATQSAVMSNMTLDDIEFTATDDQGAEHVVTIPFRQRLTARPEVREEVAHIYNVSAEMLGLAPSTEEH